VVDREVRQLMTPARSQFTIGPALVRSVTSAHVSPSSWTVMRLTLTAGDMFSLQSEKS
jgi:hypothetical protein